MVKKIENILFYVILFVLCFAFCIQTNVIDVDFFSRLIQGKHVAQTGSVMYYDIVSFAKSHIWYDHEWLSSAFFYIILMKFSVFGLTMTKTILCFLVFVLVDLCISLRQNKFDYRYKIFYILLLCYFMHAMSFYAYLRCQNFTLVFYPLLILILEYTRKNYNSKIIYLIPLLMLFWFNIHGGSMYG